MSINLGQNIWILIGLIFFELLFIIVPSLIAKIVEKNSFKYQLSEMGFHRNKDTLIKNLFKIFSGISIGFLFFIIGGYIISFFLSLVFILFGSEFIRAGVEGAISTAPVEPDIIQIIILIILQFAIIGICEEAFFRGFLIKKINKKLHISYAILISSIIFAFYHTPFPLVPITTLITFFGYYFTFGIMLSLLYLYFDYSLIPVAIAHGFFNVLIMIF